jgi:hypothetical protein
MKTIYLTLISLFFFITFSSKAQYGTILPDGFIIPKSATPPGCTVSDKGKIYYNSTTNNLLFCDGTAWKPASSQWSTPLAQPDDIYFNGGSVGINTTTPQYALDVHGTGRFTGDIYGEKLGIGTTTPSSALEVLDGDIAVTSTADAKTWKLDYSDENNNLSIRENGIARMVFANGGNITIGSGTPTAKLTVEGNGSFSGDLTVNGGKGIVRSTTSAQLKYHTASVALGTTFSVTNGGCSTANASLSAAGFTTAPTVTVGNLTGGTGDFGKLVINVQSTTTTQAVVRFCNPTASTITLTGMTFNVLCIGQ